MRFPLIIYAGLPISVTTGTGPAYVNDAEAEDAEIDDSDDQQPAAGSGEVVPYAQGKDGRVS